MPRAAYVLDAARTPVGRYGGLLAGVRPDDLAAAALRGLLARQPAVDPAQIEDVVLGNANGAGEENRDVARMAVLLAGWNTRVPGVTVNRLCASGLEAVVQASRAIAVGDASLVVAGGVESMTRAPWVTLKPERAFAPAPPELHQTAVGWRLVNPRMPEAWTIPLGAGAELLAERHRIDRDAQDAFAIESHRRAAAAWSAGRFADELLPLGDLVDAEPPRDEPIRDDVTSASLQRLRPAFAADGTVTAGNSSPLSDGASALLLADAETAARLGVEPLCRIVSSAVSALDPPLYGLGPLEASARALERAGLGWRDVAVVELNEAFAAQALACLAHWPEVDPAIVNPNGGAIALGHPLGSSGARLVTTLAHELRRRGGGYGLATLCIGVGQGLALVIEA